MRAAILVLMSVLMVGCVSPLQGVARALDSLAIVARTAEPTLEAQYASDQAGCLRDFAAVAAAEACVAKVRAAWKPAREAYRIFRTAWLGADAALRTAEALDAIGKKVDLASISAKVADAIMAADRFRVAMEQLGHPTAAVVPMAMNPADLGALRLQLDAVAAVGGA